MRMSRETKQRSPNLTLLSSFALAILLSLEQSADAFSIGQYPRRRFDGFRKVSTESSTTALPMASGGPMQCRAIGIGSATPPTRMSNADLEAVVDTSDEWIATRTGISARHVLLQGETISGLAIDAARKAVEMSGLDASEIDLVVMATSTPDDMFGDATSVARELGCNKAFAFDLTAACSGFLFGIVTAGQYLTGSGGVKNALVVGADALSRWVDWDNRNTCILFGDGAGAMVLTATEGESGFLGFSAHSDGEGQCNLNLPYKGEPRHVATPGEGMTLSRGGFDDMHMDGREVYKFATTQVPRVLNEAITAAGLTVDDLDWILLHQANIRIMESVANRMKVPMEKVIANLDEYGNTSAASIPLALDEAVRKGQVKKGDVIACSGFGAGLSWGATILKWG